jgi:hypothetical protein
MTIHLNTTMIVGLCMLPGAVVVTYVLVVLLGSMELAGAIIAAITGAAVFVVGIAVTLVGLGQVIG